MLDLANAFPGAIIKVNKAMGLDHVPSWALKECSRLLSATVTAIFSRSLREGVLPTLRNSATIIPLSKKRPPVTIDNDITPISLTPITAKVSESLGLTYVDVLFIFNHELLISILEKWQGLALIEMLDKLFESTDV